MSNNGNTLDQRTFGKLSRLYIIALTVIALSIIVSQYLVRRHLNTQESDSTIINVAGRQRMLSQKLTKDILKLNSAKNLDVQLQLKNQIKQTLSLWETSHYALQKGNDSMGLPGGNGKAIQQKFQKLNPVFLSISNAAKGIILKIENTTPSSLLSYEVEIETVTNAESDFLVLMDDIVNQYDLEASKKVNWLRQLESIITLFTLAVLLLEFLFIFWPTAKNIRATLADLLRAESKAKQMAIEADELSIAKEKSIRELRALNYAMDETLLFARITPSGSLVHMGKKFSKLFKVSRFSMSASFAEVLSVNENEQVAIENIISKYKKIGWQGEVKATTKNNQDVWLEMAFIPFNTSEEKSELLIIASDVTYRKSAQLEIERLTKKGFDEKMNHQKVISSKIIENQEKEQSRIAKDVHDGIGQMLTGLKYNLESINLNDTKKAEQKIEYLKELALNIIKGVRTATFNLTPPELSDHGIVPAITKLTQELSKLTGKNIQIFNKSNFNERLDSLVEINIYRIVQEAINNAIKYANSSYIIVSLSHSENLLSIVIDDNGKGFDPSKVEKVKNADGGMGMTFMKERIKFIDGRLFLYSEKDKGTRVTLNIPLPKQVNNEKLVILPT
ncbi:sensor histidine kinase [Neotamlana laminarinivorans]|uniref:Oxygen sensor histidine kinase NreB n=1 Tax=Neotamlana laminarinivorans TaxID=2883124 RepID=A0A9X1HXS7_9FLAO|nr:type IV pili methyl-accepting chemotaxis transducer N-terminal domain-containing protein [Tamlana laminarinivorans]MCB4798113.1 type IV pili methyl-accepting chemotaxis transducer N-terminal domain-containing protein [Tamlana laminarinivorans]